MDYTQAQKDAARAYLIDNNVSNDKDTISGLKSIGIDANALNAQLQREKSAASQNSSPANNTTNPTSQSSSASTPTPAPVQRQESAPAPVQRQESAPAPVQRQESAPAPAPVQDNTGMQTISDFKSAGATPDNLTKLLENRGIENLEIKGNRVYGESNGERFEWTIDNDNNPSKRSLGTIANEKENYAKEVGMGFYINDEGQTVFRPKDVDEAIDLYTRFGPTANISSISKEAIKGTAVFQKYNRYKGANTDTILDGLRSNEIATGGDTWDRLVKMNGGIATEQMEEARRMYDQEMKVSAINKSNESTYNTLSGTTTSVVTQESILSDMIAKIDSDYIKSKQDVFTQMEEMYAQYKEGSSATNELRQKANETASQIDEIETAKRKVLTDIQAQNPNLPLSTQLSLAQRATSDLDESLYSLQRQYNIEIADYQYEDTQDKAEFEFNMSMISTKDAMMSEIYGIQRTELSNAKSEAREDRLLSEQIQRENIIRQEDIERAQSNLEQSWAREDELYNQAIEREDYMLAEEKAYNKLLLEEQQKMNQSAYQFMTPGEGLVAVANPNTGEIEFKSIPGSASTSTGSSTTGSISGANISELGTGVDFIKKWEGFRNEAYQDVAGVWTLGFGFTTINGRSVQQGDSITRSDATIMLQAEIDRHSSWKDKVSIDLTAEQETALSSFEYNLGSGIWNYSNTGAGPVIDMVNNGDFEGAASLMQKFNRAGGKFVQGLQNRRDQEADLLLTKTSTAGGEQPSLTQDALIFNIGKSIFGSKISDAEGAKVKSFVTQGLSEGLNEDQIIDKILFFEPKNNTELGAGLKESLIVNNVDLSEFDMRRLGNLLTDGDLSSAIAKTENSVYSQARSTDPDGFISETLIKTTVRRSEELSKKINALQSTSEGQKNPIGTFNGSIEGWLGRFKSEEATQLKNDATRLVSQFRLENLGSAVTPAEEKFLDAIIPKISDSTSNFAIKVNSFGDQALGELNDFRNTLELPSIQYESLMDKSLRANGYIGASSTGDYLSEYIGGTTNNSVLNDYLNNNGY